MIDKPSRFDPAAVAMPPGRHGHRPIAAAVLLGGAVRPTKFNASVGRSLLELPCRSGWTLLDEWCDQIATLDHAAGSVPLRILSDKTGSEMHKTRGENDYRIPVRFEQDPSEWRGTGGVLRDISKSYGPDDLLLVANAGQLLLRPLSQLVHELDALRADVALLAHVDGTPTTLMLIRCGCLAALSDVGFVDMKEQALPMLAQTQDVRVVSTRDRVTLGLRTARSYLAGLRVLHSQTEAVDEPWRSAFSIVEEGAVVDPGARLHDSVILKGARVAADAVVVRSVICDGGVVARGESIVQKLVSKSGTVSSEEA